MANQIQAHTYVMFVYINLLSRICFRSHLLPPRLPHRLGLPPSQPSSQTMHALYFTLSALLAFATVHAKPQAGTPSGTPSAYSCPGTDLAAFPLGTNNSDGTTLFCSYPAFPGEDPNDFYCKYSATTGAKTQDNDAGFCPNNAVASGGARRRSPEPQVPAAPVAAPVARAPEDLKARSSLKRRLPTEEA